METSSVEKPGRGSRRRLLGDWIPFAVLGVSLLITFAVAGWARREARAKDQLRFGAEVEQARNNIRRRMELYVASLRSGAGLFAADGDVTTQSFAAYVARLDLRRQYPGEQGFGFSMRIPAGQIGRVEQDLSQQLGRPFKVWPMEPVREEYHSIVLLEPHDAPNLAALGYDMFSDSTRREAMERARDEGHSAATGKVTLVQEIDPAKKQAGFLIYVPVYRGGGIPESREERREKLAGFVYSPFRAGDLLDGIFGDMERDIDFEVYDGAQVKEESLLFRHPEANVPRAFNDTRTVVIAGRPWTVIFRSRPGFEAASNASVGMWVIVSGALISLLLFFLTSAESRARNRAERNARELEASRAAALRTLAELREIEEARQQLLQSERQARQEAENANRVKDEFLATVSHELRTPLNAMLGWAQLLHEGGLDEAGKGEAVEAIERNARAQAQLIEDLLDLSRIIRGKIHLQKKTVRLQEVIDAAIKSVAPTAARKKVELRKEIDSNVPAAQVDPTRMQQVVWNLLSNSIKFTPSDGWAQISLDQQDQQAIIRISDSGVGIAPAFLPQVFTAFRQADASTTRGHTGLGLGLAIVKNIVELHGGTVEAASEGEGRGATFTVRLPITAHVEHAPAPQRPAGQHSLDRLCVLVVDDEADSRRLLKKVLERAGAKVTMTGSVGEAMEALEREMPDVLLSDIGMPGEDGYSLIRRVRARADEKSTIPAAALTAFARAEDQARSQQEGFDLHVSKPIDARRLVEVVAMLAKDSPRTEKVNDAQG